MDWDLCWIKKLSGSQEMVMDMTPTNNIIFLSNEHSVHVA